MNQQADTLAVRVRAARLMKRWSQGKLVREAGNDSKDGGRPPRSKKVMRRVKRAHRTSRSRSYQSTPVGGMNE